MQTPFELLLSKFPNAKQTKDGYKTRCPCHDDNHESLSFGEGNNGNAVMHCFAGCANADILAAIGLTLADLMARKDTMIEKGKWEEVRGTVKLFPYDYVDANGQLLYQSVRRQYTEKNSETGATRPAKTFSQRRVAREGEQTTNGFINRMDGVQYVLYNLPTVLGAKRAVYVVEGEKDADNLAAVGLAATTNIGGAGKWKKEYTDALRNAHVVIIPDNDMPGKKHAQEVAALISDTAKSVRILELPNLKLKGDVSDWLAAGGTAAQLRDMANAVPVWTRPIPTDAPAPKPITGKMTAEDRRAAQDAKASNRARLRQEAAELAMSADGLPVVETNLSAGWHLRHATDETLRILVEANNPPTLFIRGGKLARINIDEESRASVTPIEQDMLSYQMARAINFVSTSEDRGTVPVVPPQTIVREVLASPKWNGIPPLVGLVTAPIMGADGTMYAKPGYQAQTKLYYHEPSGMSLNLGDTNPTPANVQKALDLLMGKLLKDFPFVDQSSKANALALLLLPFVRQTINGTTPFHLIDAPTAGTGKSLLAEVITEIFLPGGASPIQAPTNRDGESDNEEWRKRITTALQDGGPFFFIDNITGVLKAASLDSLLTTREWKDRILGQTKDITLPVRCVFIGTANNAEVRGDTARRTVWIRLDARTENPDERDGFEIVDIRGYVRQNRDKIIGAVFTILRKWATSKNKKWSKTPIGSFENWSQTMGGILESVGVEGFMDNRAAMKMRLNPEKDVWGGFFSLWFEAHKTNNVCVSEVSVQAQAAGIIADAERGRVTLGKYLRARVDTISGNFRLVDSGFKSHGAIQYRIEPLEKGEDSEDSEDSPPPRRESKNITNNSNTNNSNIMGDYSRRGSTTSLSSLSSPFSQDGLKHTLAILRNAHAAELEPKRVGVRLAIHDGRIVWVENGRATAVWAGGPDGKPVKEGYGRKAMETWPWEAIETPYLVPAEFEDSEAEL